MSGKISVQLIPQPVDVPEDLEEKIKDSFGKYIGRYADVETLHDMKLELIKILEPLYSKTKVVIIHEPISKRSTKTRGL